MQQRATRGAPAPNLGGAADGWDEDGGAPTERRKPRSTTALWTHVAPQIPPGRTAAEMMDRDDRAFDVENVRASGCAVRGNWQLLASCRICEAGPGVTGLYAIETEPGSASKSAGTSAGK